MKKATILNWLIFAFMLIPFAVFSQAADYTMSPSSTMIITGTSTIHDWEADVEELQLTVDINPDMMLCDSTAEALSALTVTVPVTSIESGKGGMNNKIYGALESKKHPNITFKLADARLTDMKENAFTLQLKGNLTIAGFTREVTFPVTGMKENEKGYRFKGSYGLNMKDYKVDPPSAMFGAIKSGEEVEIAFDILLTRNNL